MKLHRLIGAAFAAASLLSFGIPSAGQNPTDVRQAVLSNGMEVWLNEDHGQPVVKGSVVVKAGAKDCPDTGLAHYLEHLLFKGTEELGTVDYAAEKVWLDSIAVCYDILAETVGEAERAAIQKKINLLSLKAADYAIPNEFDLLTAAFGGTGLNAATSYDYTYYYNTFSPQYLAQWAELNSHRLLHPVFRLFQGELETVYEEKNRSADNTMQAPLFEMFRQLGKDNPYSYPVIGSTENLKNPRLGEMMAFFKKYYVGSNMGLILTGDFDADSVLPLLERTFGRIPRGVKPEKAAVPTPDYSGQRTVKIKADIPLIKISLFAFNGPTDRDADAPALNLATAILTNSFGSGLLDSLTTNHKVLLSGAMRVPLFNELGIVGYAVVPSLPFGSLPKAEKVCREQIEKVKRGEFSDATVEALKLEAARDALASIETVAGRGDQMVSIMAQDRSWEDYLKSVESIRSLTRDDIVRVANKYFNDQYIRFEKVKGTYPKDKIAKPGFAPVVPKHAGEESAYAKALKQMPAADIPPRLLDFENDITRIPLNEHVTLYYKANPVNDLFSLSVQVDEGSREDPRIPHVAGYVNTVGTDSLSIQQLAKAWQELGTSFSAGSDSHQFFLDISGFDSNLEPSLRLLQHVTDHLKGDKDSFKELKTGIDLEKKTFLSEGTSSIMQATMQRVIYGEEAPRLTGLTSKELNAVGEKGLQEAFRTLMGTECSIFYSGSLPAEQVAGLLKKRLNLSGKTRKPQQRYVPFKRYDTPTIFFYDLPGSRQTQIMTYQAFDAPADGRERANLQMLGNYVGGGMYSLMFQEVREFRSMAYSASGTVSVPPPVLEDRTAMFYTTLGTQADKAMGALELVDSLLREMPLKEAGLDASARTVVARANNGYPSFRAMGGKIHQLEVSGYKDDPDRAVLENLPSVTAETLKEYYESVVRKAPVHRVIVGDRKTLPMDELARYGTIVYLKEKDIYK